MPAAPTPPAPVKHRACDECRTRKLACSKDPDGCERCRKEKISCHYSEQKPMGRPRKRQFIEASDAEQVSNSTSLGVSAQPYIVSNSDAFNANGSIDPAFLDGLMEVGAPVINGVDVHRKKDWDNTPHARWNFGNGDVMTGPPIDFGSGPLVTESSPQTMNESNPSLSDSGSSPPATAPCSCLASMYLALASLQQLPTDIVEALKVVRGAARTAAQTIWCPSCGYVVMEMATPPMESFQNTMLLGTILPIIANSYKRLLKMVDDETEIAEATGKTKIFRFHDYGGLCGTQASIQEALTCVAKEMFFDPVEMPPHQWRASVRALMRVDIYGHEQGDFKHKGLKDLVSEMESRQRARHEFMDASAAAGIPIGGHGLFGNDCSATQPGSMHTCLQVLNIAKTAIDSLVIA